VFEVAVHGCWVLVGSFDVDWYSLLLDDVMLKLLGGGGALVIMLTVI